MSTPHPLPIMPEPPTPEGRGTIRRLRWPLSLLATATVISAACGPAPVSDAAAVGTVVAALQAPDSVPRELVVALLAGFAPDGAEAPELLVGRVPTGLPTGLQLPEDARLLGSLAYAGHGTVVTAVPRPAEDVLRGAIAALRESGWRDPPGRAMGGFHPGAGTVPVVLCRGRSGSVRVSAIARPESETGSYLRFGYDTRRDSSPCDARFAREHPMADLPFPGLFPPEGARHRDTGMGGSLHRMEAYAVVETTLGAAELAGRYGDQLRAQGWTPAERAGTGSLIVETWQHGTEDESSWQGLLVLGTHAGSDNVEVAFRVSTVGRGDSADASRRGFRARP